LLITFISYNDLGRRYEALTHREKVLEMSEVMMGKEHPTTLASIGNLATSYSDLGPRHRVAGLKKKILEVSQRIRGEPHPNTLQNLAIAASQRDLVR